MWRFRQAVRRLPLRCAEVRANPLGVAPPRQARRGRARPLAATAGLGLIGGAAYVATCSESERDDLLLQLRALGTQLDTAFEDFNDNSREFFEQLGDKIPHCARPDEHVHGPWLADLKDMKFPPYVPTLVMGLDKVILRLEHDSRTGWRVVKRPHADKFLQELQHYYELVVFSEDVFPIAQDIMQKWEAPVAGVLHRDLCKRRRNHFVKDLSKLGRKMDKVLLLDWDPAAYQLQEANGVQVKPFAGSTDPDDNELLLLLDLLKAAAVSGQDLRTFIQKHGGGDLDIGRRFQSAKEQSDALVAQRRKKSRAFSMSSTPRNDPRAAGSMSVGRI